jgi:hypothetical protein
MACVRCLASSDNFAINQSSTPPPSLSIISLSVARLLDESDAADARGLLVIALMGAAMASIAAHSQPLLVAHTLARLSAPKSKGTLLAIGVTIEKLISIVHRILSRMHDLRGRSSHDSACSALDCSRTTEYRCTIAQTEGITAVLTTVSVIRCHDIEGTLVLRCLFLSDGADRCRGREGVLEGDSARGGGIVRPISQLAIEEGLMSGMYLIDDGIVHLQELTRILSSLPSLTVDGRRLHARRRRCAYMP